MGEKKFSSGLKATNDAYALRAGLVEQPKITNPVITDKPPVEPVDPAGQGLTPVKGAVKAPAKKTAAKKTAAKKAPAKKAVAKKTAAK